MSPVLLAKNVFSIAAGTPFLPRLARFVLDGYPDASQVEDPFHLARTTIYLPTRRAVRSLRGEFSVLLGSKATFLPRLRTLGDGDQGDMDPFLARDQKSDPPRLVSPLTRQIMLARLVKRWVEMIGAQTRELFEDEDIIIPSSSAESLWLAREIGDLIDQMETEEISWESLKLLVPNKDAYANWWQLTLEFLQIAMQSWPEQLAQMNACDPATHRRLLLDIRSAQLSNISNGERVIAAGSTGSIPATARFLKSISQLEHGAVILPGLDTSMSSDAWAEVSGRYSPDPTFSGIQKSALNPSGCEDHPQYGLAKLLKTIGISREEVEILGKPSIELNTRSELASIALLPSAQTGEWRALVKKFSPDQRAGATNGITIIEAPAERQEALAIALVLRQQIETPDVYAALVTPDRNLARRVAAELKRFGLNIDDSAGIALKNTAAAIFIRLLISVATRKPDALTLATFVKHPLLQWDNDKEAATLSGRHFEICLLRDVLEIPSAGKFHQAIINSREKLAANRHAAPMIAKMSADDGTHLELFCQRLDDALTPLIEVATSKEPVKIAGLFENLLKTAINLTSTDDGSDLFGSEAGIEINRLFEEITNSGSSEFAGNFTCRPDELLSVFDALIAGKIIRTNANTHPRISILGPLEARLQPLDCVILGGLNEGTWPTQHDNGPFLNRPMKLAMELATPERRTGLSAHDFEQLLGLPQVYLTRSGRVDNAPTVPSRWLQRLTAIFGTELTEEIAGRGAYFLQLATLLDQPPVSSRRIERPCPKPAVIHRPTRLSVTEIETWIRDPYAIYAKHILQLKPLGAIGTGSEPALRGTILHDAVAEFVEARIDPFGTDASGEFLVIIRDKLQQYRVPAHLSAMWMPRFGEMAQDYIRFEQKRQPHIKQSHCEIDGAIIIADTGFELRGRADRIDVMNDDSIEILDYKSGLKPTPAMARTLAPQLALEGGMAMAGGFVDLGKKTPSKLEYVRLRARGEFKQQAVNNEIISAAELSSAKIRELEQHINKYKNPDQGYLSRFAIELAENFTADYDHLARVREWSWGSDEAGDGGDYG